MLQFVLAGLALGAIYAIASASLVVTFVSAGVLNFAFGSTAFVVARVYYGLNSERGWSSPAAAVVSLLVFAPLLGAALYALLFRHLRTASTLVKLVATIGLSVALPAGTNLLFGTSDIQAAPGLTAAQETPLMVLGVPVTNDQLLTYLFLLLVVGAGVGVLRWTDAGLRVRALVDSQAMASLSAIDPGRVSVVVWAVSTTLAGLAGILVAPTNGLSVGGMTTLMAAAFAAVVAARLQSLGVAVVVSLAMGVVTDVVQYYLPPDSSFTAAIVPSIPFGFIVVSLLVHLARTGGLSEGTAGAGPLDAAVRPAQAEADAPVAARAGLVRSGLPVLPLVALAAVPLLLRDNPYWLGLLVTGLCFGVIFLTFTVVTGEGGMLWLSQVAFAGTGALFTGQFATAGGLPVLLAVLLAAVVAAVAGAVVGLLTIRLGDLYVALVTLTFSLLVETLVFTRERFQQGGLGVLVPRPGFAQDDLAFAYLALAVFGVFGLLTLNLRRSTSGLALRAVRDSESAARTLGLSVLQVKVLVGALAAFVAAVGGGLLAMSLQSAQPASYPTFAGLVWLAIVVTLGVRSIVAAALAGVSFALLPGVFQTYVPSRYAEVPAVLFGLGAIALAQHPEGSVAQLAAQLRRLTSRPATASPPTGPEPGSPPGSTSAGPATPAARLGVRRRPRTDRVDTDPRGGPMTAAVTAGPGSLQTTARLSCDGVTVRFGGLVAVDDVAMEVGAGEVVGLVGPNGAGKSTLFAVLSGLLIPAAGTVQLDGHDISGSRPQERARRGLSRTFQHPQLFGGLTVREHLVLAHRARHVRRRTWSDLFTLGALRGGSPAEREVVDTLVEGLGLTDLAHRPALGLPLGLARIVELARALACEPSVLLLDEPSSGLDPAETEQFASVVRRVSQERGISVLLVEHDVELVMRLSQRVYVLEFGRLIASGVPDVVRADPAVRAAYLGEEPETAAAPSPTAPTPTPSAHTPAPAPTPAPAVLRERAPEPGAAPAAGLVVQGLSVRYGDALALSDVSFRLDPGRAVAVVGPNGAGKSSLARVLTGLVPAAGGRLLLDGDDVTGEPAHRLRDRGVVHLPEGRGVFRSLDVLENLRLAVGGMAGRAERRAAVDAALDLFPTLAERRTVAAGSLSGGQQQMLSLARAMVTRPRLVVADEMSLGLAPLMVDAVFDGLDRMRLAGVTVVMVEQYVHRALAYADDCLVLQRGRLAWSGPAAQAGEQVLRHYLGADDASSAPADLPGGS